MRKAVVLALLLMMPVVSCAQPEIGQLGGPATHSLGPTAQLNDPALSAAADVVQPLLESAFASTYAGLEMRHEVPMMVVYRKPDPRLDAEVREAAPNVRVEFRDARYTQTEMAAHVTRVMDDIGFWKGRGAALVSAGPKVDGSGVKVGVTTAPDDIVGQLEAYYPAMSFSVEKSGEIVPAPYTGPVPVFPSR